MSNKKSLKNDSHHHTHIKYNLHHYTNLCKNTSPICDQTTIIKSNLGSINISVLQCSLKIHIFQMKFCMELLNIVLKERTLPPVVNSIMSTHHYLLARDLNQNAPDNHRNSSNGPNIICLMLIKRLSSVMP